MPFLLGLTGNIGCGKSTIGQHLSRRYAAEYIDADRLVHALYAPGSPETHAIAQRFGPELLQPDGAIDRRRLGDIVLRDPDAMRQLEALLDPGVLQAISDRLRQTTAAVVVLDAIRLIESGLGQRCDTIWVVVCDQSAQLERLLSRGFTPEQARVRITAQTPAESKVAHADVVITNNGSLEELLAQVDRAWNSTVAQVLGESL